MEAFLKETLEGEKLELLIDTKIFKKDIILKTAFQFLDRGYFFFKIDNDENIILQLTKREKKSDELREIIWDFSDSLLESYLRDRLEKDNKVIREAIVTKAINGPLDQSNFVTLDTNAWEQVWNNAEENEINFDKDIDDILKEVENDPDLKIDEAEIEKILNEIEQETGSKFEKPWIVPNLEALKNAKKQFKQK